MADGTSLFLQIVENHDGSLTRPSVPLIPPTADDHRDSPVHSRDVPLDPTNDTWLRIYRPNLPSSPPAKLPIILYFHGGGFVVFSTSSVFYHLSCEQMSTALPALVLSLDYRLAPEHRLPAAYDDAVASLLWLRSHAAVDPWISESGDVSRLFLMGTSSGANMAYHAALRTADLDLAPLTVNGLILNQPYFGGVERTPSELASEEDVTLPLRANDLLWRLALPEGANRDHEFCNPLAAPPPPPSLLRLPRCLVRGCDGDPLVDRQRSFAAMLEGAGVSVVSRLDDKGYHAIEIFDPAKAQSMVDDIRDFVYGSSVDDAVAA